MIYLVAIFVPPLAILLSGRPVQAVFNGLLWLLAMLLLILPFVPGMLTWLITVIWAMLVVRAQRQEERDRRLIDEALLRDRERRWG